MTELSNQSSWGKLPFKLLSTPKFERMKNGKDNGDPYVQNASIMAVLHNIVMRGLNSIYLQATHLKPKEYKDFINYCYCWYVLLESHHRAEEERFFPELERRTGEKGVMDVNVEQHPLEMYDRNCMTGNALESRPDAFQPGLEAYKAYLDSLKDCEYTFSAPRLLSIIDSFSAPLCQHMSEEIPTLLDLSRYGDLLPIVEMGKTEGRKSSAEMQKTGVLIFFLLNHDRTYENGLWAQWPPIPPPIRWAMTRVFGSWNRGWWRFASCDFDGRPKPLIGIGNQR